MVETNAGRLARLKWRSKITGSTGEGQKAFDANFVQQWVERLNADHPYIDHWMEYEEGVDA